MSTDRRRLCQTKIDIGRAIPAARGSPRRLGSPRSVGRGPCGGPARRGPAQGSANASSYQSWFNIDGKGSLLNQDRRRSNQLVAQGPAIALEAPVGKREAGNGKPPEASDRGLGWRSDGRGLALTLVNSGGVRSQWAGGACGEWAGGARSKEGGTASEGSQLHGSSDSACARRATIGSPCSQPHGQSGPARVCSEFKKAATLNGSQPSSLPEFRLRASAKRLGAARRDRRAPSRPAASLTPQRLHGVLPAGGARGDEAGQEGEEYADAHEH